LFKTDPVVTQVLVLIIFIVILAILIAEKIDKTALALIGATTVCMILYIFPQEALHDKEIISAPLLLDHLPWNTIMFIFFMMLVVTSSARSGLFQWFAVVAIQVTKGHTKTLYFAFYLLTFIISFFFDTVTTMLIMAPLTIEIMKVLDRDFRPYLITEAIVANFGSIPSLIGSVPNIIIGNEADLSFIQFLLILGPLAIILFFFTIPILFYFQKDVLKEQQKEVEDMDKRIFLLDATLVIKQPRLFIFSIFGLFILILGFTFGQLLDPPISPVLTAMTAMTFLLIANRDEIPEILREVQWGTIFFIVGLLIIVQAMEDLGLILKASELLQPVIEESPELGTFVILWMGGLLSGAVDNIPISAAFAKMIANLEGGGIILPLALIFGVNIGGYLSPIASPANLLAFAYAENEHVPISFFEFAKYGTSLAFIHLIIGSFYFILLGQLGVGI
jgi:Na+/H+ antiporter NhaD/arsenite permease-like protein